jgi:hypothetical protein
VLQAVWKVAAVDNGCMGATSNEVTIHNNQPTMEAAFVKGSFINSEGLQIKLTNMVNVDMNSIVFSVTLQRNGSVTTATPTPTNNVYNIVISGIPTTRRYTIGVSFRDNKGGACSNSLTIGEVDRNASAYTVVSGDILPAQQSDAIQAAMAKAMSVENYDDEAEWLYREYVTGLRNDEHKAFLAPTYTGSTEGVKLLIYSVQPEQVTVTVYSSMGSTIATKQLTLSGGGITEHWLSAHEKPQVAGMYYVVIEYINGTRETLKGVVK